MPKIRENQNTPEQEFSRRRYEAVESIARDAGFDDEAIAYTEFCLMPFFEAVVEYCAREAELAARSKSTTEDAAGISAAAAAVRAFGKMTGNYPTQKYTIGPMKK